MIRKATILILILVGTGLSLVGWLGQCMSDKAWWRYRPDDFRLSHEQAWIAIGLGSLAGQWVSIDGRTPHSSLQTPFFWWLDRPAMIEGVAVRLRLIVIPAFVVISIGALLLAYPVIAFVRRRHRREHEQKSGHH